MDTRVEEIKILDHLFDDLKAGLSEEQFNSLRADISNNERAALKEYLCRHHTIDKISERLETSAQEIQRLIASGLVGLKRHRQMMRAGIGPNILFFRRHKVDQCRRCSNQLSSHRPERYCNYCFWDELSDPIANPPINLSNSNEGKKDV